MTTLTEDLHAGNFIESEANGSRSRERITAASGEELKAGHVFGKTLTGGEATPAAYAINAANTGTMGTVTVTGQAKIGRYRATIIEPASNAGKFIVEDPDGVQIGTGNVASVFTAGGLSFTIADGSQDFVSGEGFTIDVTGEYQVKEYDPTNTDGSEKAAGIAFDAIDASAAAADGVGIVRDAEVKAAALVWFSGATDDQKAAGLAELALLGIIGR